MPNDKCRMTKEAQNLNDKRRVKRSRVCRYFDGPSCKFGDAFAPFRGQKGSRFSPKGWSVSAQGKVSVASTALGGVRGCGSALKERELRALLQSAPIASDQPQGGARYASLPWADTRLAFQASDGGEAPDCHLASLGSPRHLFRHSFVIWHSSFPPHLCFHLTTKH